jgi:hypothetical protein
MCPVSESWTWVHDPEAFARPSSRFFIALLRASGSTVFMTRFASRITAATAPK